MNAAPVSIALALALLVAGCTSGEEAATTETPATAGDSATDTASASPVPSIDPVVRANPSHDLAFIGADGTTLWLLQTDGALRTIYKSNRGTIRYIAWSPDGKKIAFTENAFVDEGALVGYYDVLSVVVITIEGVEISRTPHSAMAHWSPDSTRLSVLSEFDAAPRGEASTSVPAVLDLTTGSLLPLGASTWLYDAPVWSPSGQQLAFASFETGLTIVASDGSDSSARLPGQGVGAHYLAPQWFPRDQILVFERPQSGAPVSDAYVVTDASGQILQRIPDERDEKCGRSWFLGDAEADWVGASSSAVWPAECESTPGIWIKDLLGGGDSTFVDLSDLPHDVGFVDVHPDGRSLLLCERTGIGPGSRRSPSPELANRFQIYEMAIGAGADYAPRLIVENGVEPVWQPGR